MEIGCCSRSKWDAMFPWRSGIMERRERNVKTFRVCCSWLVDDSVDTVWVLGGFRIFIRRPGTPARFDDHWRQVEWRSVQWVSFNHHWRNALNIAFDCSELEANNIIMCFCRTTFAEGRAKERRPQMVCILRGDGSAYKLLLCSTMAAFPMP